MPFRVIIENLIHFNSLGSFPTKNSLIPFQRVFLVYSVYGRIEVYLFILAVALIILSVELILLLKEKLITGSKNKLTDYAMVNLISIPIFALMQNLHDIDIGILKWIFENRNQSLDPAIIFITNSAAAIAFGVPGILLLFAIYKKIIGLRREALMMLIPVAISSILANSLKYVFNTPRPYEMYSFIQKLSVGGSPSFPSGHTADAFAFAIAVCLVYPKWYIIIPCLIWASLVGYTRMSLGVHFPSDVIGGALIGAACSYAYIFYAKRKHLKSQ